jgi:small-conductance mechanosensitive channel
VGVPVALLGAFTVAITVAFQNILAHLVAGFYILVERPFYIGDQIYIPIWPISYIGKVEDIQLRATRLRLTSGEEVSIPNLQIFNNAVINNTFYGERRSVLEITLPVAKFSREETTSDLINAIRKHEEVLEKPEPIVMITSYVVDNVVLQLRFWVATSQFIDISNVMYELHVLMPESTIKVLEPSTVTKVTEPK